MSRKAATTECGGEMVYRQARAVRGGIKVNRGRCWRCGHDRLGKGKPRTCRRVVKVTQ